MNYDPRHKITCITLMMIILTGIVIFTIFEFNADAYTNIDDYDIQHISAYTTNDYTDHPTISIESPVHSWRPNYAIPVTVIDNNANRNDQLDEAFDATDPDSHIPTLVIGEPFTLSRSNGTTWIGFYVQPGTPEFERLSLSKSDPTINDPTRLNLNNTNDDPLRLRGDYTDDRPDLTGFIQSTVTDFSSDRNILTFNDEFDILTQNSIDALGIVDSGNTYLGAFDILILDFDHTNLKDILINNEEDDGQHGFNMLNYDISSLGDDIILDKIQINVARQKVAVLDTDGSSGYVPVPQEFVTTIHASDRVGQLQIVLFVSGQDVDSNTEYPLFLDFFSFGYVNDDNSNDTSNDTNETVIANQVIRFELEESTDNQGTFTGTLDYFTVNRENILDGDVYTDMSPTSRNPSFIVIEEQINNNNNNHPALQIKYKDLNANLPTPADESQNAYADKIMASNLRVTDSSGDVLLDTIPVDTQVQITTNLSNTQSTNQPFAYLVQVQDADGVTVAISWISGSLPDSHSFISSASWTPAKTGMHTVTAFVWKSVDDPMILSSPISIDVSVT